MTFKLSHLEGQIEEWRRFANLSGYIVESWSVYWRSRETVWSKLGFTSRDAASQSISHRQSWKVLDQESQVTSSRWISPSKRRSSAKKSVWRNRLIECHVKESWICSSNFQLQFSRRYKKQQQPFFKQSTFVLSNKLSDLWLTRWESNSNCKSIPSHAKSNLTCQQHQYRRRNIADFYVFHIDRQEKRYLSTSSPSSLYIHQKSLFYSLIGESFEQWRFLTGLTNASDSSSSLLWYYTLLIPTSSSRRYFILFPLLSIMRNTSYQISPTLRQIEVQNFNFTPISLYLHVEFRLNFEFLPCYPKSFIFWFVIRFSPISTRFFFY